MRVVGLGQPVLTWPIGLRRGANVIPPPPPLTGAIRPAIASLLSAIPDVASLVGSRVYFGAFPQTAAVPAVAFSLSSRTYGHNLGGSNGVSSGTLEIAVRSYSESIADQIAQAIRDRLDGLHGSYAGADILSILYADESDAPIVARAGSDQWIYLVEVTYDVKHRVSIPTN